MNQSEMKSKVEIISDEIIKYITNNDLKAGDKLPNEYDFAKVLGVGRSTVRESMKALSSRNILTIKRGSGTFVSEKLGVSEDPLGLSFVQDREKLARDILDVRFLIEPFIASRAALNATDEDKKKIEKLCDEIDILITLGKNHLEKDVEFHVAIANSSGNIIVPKLLPIINQSIYLLGNLTKLQLIEMTTITHREILNAIKKGDSVAAHDAMYLHLVHNRRAIEK